MARRRRKKDRAKGVRIISIAEMMQIRNELERVSRPGTSMVDQAAVLTMAMQFADTYYKTGKGQLRRTFPKASAVVLFNGVQRPPKPAPLPRGEEHEQAG